MYDYRRMRSKTIPLTREWRFVYSSNWDAWSAHDYIEETNTQVRSEWKMPRFSSEVEIEDDFVMKLFDDEFWESDYLERGAVSLVQEAIADICRAGSNTNAYRSIPISIKDLFRNNDGSYAKRLYVQSANPGRKLRDRTVLEN